MVIYMKSVGIICEYNPFHNGHLYHLNKIKELYKDYTIILVLNSYFMQRGDTSIFDKWTKTDIALNLGVDLVIELPFVFGTQSSDIFAKGAIEILKELKVDILVFGSESDDINKLNKIAKIGLKNKNFDTLIKKYFKEGISYPLAVSKATYKLTGENVKEPNDLLGISYIKEILKQKASITPYTIKRNNSYHSLNINDYSGTALRKALLEKKSIKKYVPPITYRRIPKRIISFDNYFSLLKYKIEIDKNKLDIYQTVDEGIENRIIKNIETSSSLEELISKIKTKRYTYNKIKRMLVHILCSFTKEEATKCSNITYIRTLGFNMTGQQYLKAIKKEISIPIISKYSDINCLMLDIELRSICVYASIFNDTSKKDFIINEIAHKPIIYPKRKD